jgi:Holliday junction DNA helicase RuvA
MIARLTGQLEQVTGNTALVRPAGALGEAVTLELLLPAYLAKRLTTRVGETLTLRTSVVLQGESQGSSFVPQVLAFASEDELAFFDLFTTVKGIGVRKAMRALAEPPGHIAAAIMRADAKALSQLPEIGKRLAETIIAELKGKADRYASAEGLAPGAPVQTARAQAVEPKLAGAAGDAVEALMKLGEVRAEAERKVLRAQDRLSAGGAKVSADALIAAVFAGG